MRSGFALMLGLAFAFAAGAGSPALGQEAGESGESADEAAAAPEPSPSGHGRAEDASLRKAPTRKKGGRAEFDPKVFEARGRELQGEYYEIASFAQAPVWSSAPTEAAVAPEPPSRGNWLLWTGAAGLTALVAGAAGYLYLESSDPEKPETVFIDDKP